MLSKIILLFLAFIAILAMLGKLRLPCLGGRNSRHLDARKCPHCGAFRIGSGPCACGRK